MSASVCDEVFTASITDCISCNQSMRQSSGTSVPLMQVTSASGVVDQTASVNPNGESDTPNVDAWDPRKAGSSHPSEEVNVLTAFLLKGYDWLLLS